MKSWKPSSSSSSWIWRLNGGWDIFSRFAARPKCSSSATVRLPPLRDFPGYGGKDQKKRFMALITHRTKPDENYRASFSAVTQRVSELKRGGVVLDSYLGSLQADPWRGFLIFRESGAELVFQHLKTLPLASYFNFDITELTQL